jgi:hypothetical protein
MSTRNHIPNTVSASLEARLAPYGLQEDGQVGRRTLEDLDVEVARSVEPHDARRLRLLPSLKLLFASLGAGNAVVPLGDNHRAARLLAEYANSLRTN